MVRKPTGDVHLLGAFDNDYNGAQSAFEMTLVLGSASVALGQDSTLIYSHPNWKQHNVI